MAMGRQGDCQGDLMVTWSEMPRSPGHVFYDRLQGTGRAGFDGFVEEACRAYYARTMVTIADWGTARRLNGWQTALWKASAAAWDSEAQPWRTRRGANVNYEHGRYSQPKQAERLRKLNMRWRLLPPPIGRAWTSGRQRATVEAVKDVLDGMRWLVRASGSSGADFQPPRPANSLLGCAALDCAVARTPAHPGGLSLRCGLRRAGE